MASLDARAAIRSHLQKALNTDRDSPELLFALTSFHKFYVKNYDKCMSSVNAEDAGVHKLMRVPKLAYRILQSLGFCTALDANGVERPVVDEHGIPVCDLFTAFHRVGMLGTNIKSAFSVKAQIEKLRDDISFWEGYSKQNPGKAKQKTPPLTAKPHPFASGKQSAEQ
jgi:hypothetical protein